MQLEVEHTTYYHSLHLFCTCQIVALRNWLHDCANVMCASSHTQFPRKQQYGHIIHILNNRVQNFAIAPAAKNDVVEISDAGGKCFCLNFLCLNYLVIFE